MSRSTDKPVGFLKNVLLGLQQLRRFLNTLPPAKERIGLLQRLFNPSGAKVIRDTNSLNETNFYDWQQAIRKELKQAELLGIAGVTALAAAAILFQVFSILLLTIPWVFCIVVLLSRIAPSHPEPTLVASHEPKLADAAGVLRGARVLGGLLMGAKLGAGVGLAAGPLGAIAGTLPGALLGALIGGLGGNQLGKHLQEDQIHTRSNGPRQKAAPVGGFIAGACTGALLGSNVGIAAGPLGAIAGTVPGAIIGGLVGVLCGTAISNSG